MTTVASQPDGEIRVLSVPPRHPYVDAISPLSVRSVAADRVSGFAPDPVLDAASVASLAGDAQLLHLHFGYDHLDARQLRAFTAALDRQRLPLVLTVHDLRNPHHLDPGPHHQALQVLTGAAAAVVTLTPGAAAEISARYGRVAQVLRHPTLVEPSRTADIETEYGLVVVHLKSLRANLLDPVPLVAAAARGARRGGGRLRVDLHPEVRNDSRLAGLESAGADIQVHHRFDDLELERYLRRAQVTVIPHRWGTHSGWLELARDLGTAVVAPRNGYYREQWPEVHGYDNTETSGLDPETLSAAVESAVRRPPPPPAGRSARLTEAVDVRTAHEELYRRVLTGDRR